MLLQYSWIASENAAGEVKFDDVFISLHMGTHDISFLTVFWFYLYYSVIQ